MLQILNHILSCKNICERIKAMNSARYVLGLKWCRLCEAAFDTTKRFCECCGRWLRTKAHSSTSIRKRAGIKGKSSLDKMIAVREKNREYFRRWYQKHHNDPDFKQKYNAKKRRYYARNPSKIRAKVNQRWHLIQYCLHAIT